MAYTFTKKENTDFEPLPEGEYEVEIEETKIGRTSSDRAFLSIKLRVREGTYKGRILFDSVFEEIEGDYKGSLNHKKVNAIMNASSLQIEEGFSLEGEGELREWLAGQLFRVSVEIEFDDYHKKNRNRIRFYRKTKSPRQTLGEQPKQEQAFEDDDLPF